MSDTRDTTIETIILWLEEHERKADAIGQPVLAQILRMALVEAQAALLLASAQRKR